MAKIQQHIPRPTGGSLVSLTIKVNGKELSGQHEVMSAVVDFAVNRIASARIRLRDGNVQDQDFTSSSSDEFILGNEVEILAGYDTHVEPLFKGLIVHHGIGLMQSGHSYLELFIKDKAEQMAQGYKRAIFEEKTDSEIIQDLVDQYGLESELEPTTVTHLQVSQFMMSDWDFVLSRAEANGLLVLNQHGVFKLFKPELQEAKLGLEFGSSIFDFEGRIDAREYWHGSTARSWDPALQELSSSTGDNLLGQKDSFKKQETEAVTGSAEREFSHAALNSQELQAWAKARLQSSALARKRGRLSCAGFPDILPGDTIQIAGMGDRFNGKAFVSEVRHQIAEGDWRTHIGFGLSSDCYLQGRSDAQPLPAAGLLGAASGLHIGVVTALEGDPAGEDRIRVRLPLLKEHGEGLWARMASPDAGNDRGMCFRPEIDDEVIIGFLQDDPRHPIVLGQLHSSAKPAPIAGSDDNHEKGFTTRSGMKLHFNDDKVSAKLESPKGKKILFDEDEGIIQLEDEYGNKISLGSDGISLSSAKDLNLEAIGNVSIKGVNVDAEANASFTAKGNASAELSASGVTKVKGSMVQIN